MKLPTGFSRISRVLRTILTPLLLLSAMPAGSAEYIDVRKAATGERDEALRAAFAELDEIHRKLAKASGIDARLLLSTSDEVNAFATEAKGEKLIVLNLGLLEALREDRDAVISVLAHEYAHHGKEHIASGKSTDSALGVIGALVGGIIDYKLGTRTVGREVGQFGSTLISRAFSRDQEREADAQGLAWMVEAGYNPQGAVRAQRKFLEMDGAGSSSLFRTHPGSEERVENIEKAIAGNEKAKALSSDQRIALSLPEESDDDEPSDQAQPALTGGRLPEPTAAMLEAVRGIDLARYARIANDMVFLGSDDKALKLHRLSRSDYERISNAWNERMRDDTSFALSARYGMLYYEASQGKYAEWGRDLAAAQKTGEALKKEPPIPAEDWIALFKAQTAAGQNGQFDTAAFEKATRAKGLTPYDFHIVSSWWFQRAKERAARGDMSLLQKLG